MDGGQAAKRRLAFTPLKLGHRLLKMPNLVVSVALSSATPLYGDTEENLQAGSPRKKKFSDVDESVERNMI